MLHFFIVAQKKPIIITKKKTAARLKAKKPLFILIFNVLGTTYVENLSSMSFHQELLR